MHCRRWVAAIGAAGLSLGLAQSSSAAPVIIQDYEPPGNADAPFNLFPDHSGSTVGVDGTIDNSAHVPDDGANGTTASRELTIPHLASESPTAAGWQWQVRIIPNNAGNSDANNPAFASDGSVGYWIKVDSSVTTNMLTAPLLEGAAGTGSATGGVLRTVIRDGAWHQYVWNLDDPNDFPNTFNTFYGGGLGDTTLEATVSFDSIALVSDSGGNAVVRMDEIYYDNTPIPEPGSLALLGLGLMTLGGRRRR